MKCFAMVIMGLTVVAGLSSCAQTIASVKEPENSLGVREWAPITNGLFFIDGEYLPPPYVVSRNEANVLLNGRCVDTVLQWPPRKKQPYSAPETDIAIPSTIDKKTTQYDACFINYVNYKKDYLIGKYGKDKGIERMVEVYRSLPCVKDAQIKADDPNCISVTWITGEINNINQDPPQRKDDNLSVEQATQYVDKTAEIYVRGLGAGNFFMEGVAKMRGTTESYARVLQPLADAMRTCENEKMFIATLRTNQLFSGFSDKAFQSYFKHKDDLPKWEPKMRKDNAKNEK